MAEPRPRPEVGLLKKQKQKIDALLNERKGDLDSIIWMGQEIASDEDEVTDTRGALSEIKSEINKLPVEDQIRLADVYIMEELNLKVEVGFSEVVSTTIYRSLDEEKKAHLFELLAKGMRKQWQMWSRQAEAQGRKPMTKEEIEERVEANIEETKRKMESHNERWDKEGY